MFEPSTELATMIEAARTAGTGLMRQFRGRARLQVELKGPADFVSAADLDSERTLRAALLSAYPSYGFLAEESPPTVGADASVRFIVDPLDGTTNFLNGIPHFAIAIALEREKRVVAGVVFDPAKDELFVGEQGYGAWLGRQGTGYERLHVASDTDLSRALVGTGIPHANGAVRHEAYLAMLAATMREAAGIRRFAAAALDLAYVAAGRFAVFFELGLAPWDMAAGAILVREAGGQVSEPLGENEWGFLESGEVLATNGRLHGPMMALLRRATTPRG
jgi:myo-inositol-1(or 4)-monophosphatase